MGKTFSFWRACVKRAAHGNSAFANDWQWLVGYPVTAAALWILGYFYAELSGRIEVTLTTGALGALAAAFIAYIITWSASFVRRLLDVPAVMFYEQKDRADALQQQLALLDALEIIFDPTNPARRFWSIEQMRNEAGEQIAGTFWEYRAVIKNKSARTVRNAKVTVEAIGIMPTRPELSLFDINKKSLIDLTPGEESLAVIRRWFNPPIVQGMVIGEGAYGPIKMTASADDVLPATKVFQFDPMQTPMIFELDSQ